MADIFNIINVNQINEIELNERVSNTIYGILNGKDEIDILLIEDLRNYMELKNINNIMDLLIYKTMEGTIEKYFNSYKFGDNLKKYERDINNFINKHRLINNLFRYYNRNNTIIEKLYMKIFLSKLLNDNFIDMTYDYIVNDIQIYKNNIINIIDRIYDYRKDNEIKNILSEFEDKLNNKLMNKFKYNIIKKDYDRTNEAFYNKLSDIKRIIESIEILNVWCFKCSIRIGLFKVLNTDINNIFTKYDDKIYLFLNKNINTLKNINMYILDNKFIKYKEPLNNDTIILIKKYTNKLINQLNNDYETLFNSDILIKLMEIIYMMYNIYGNKKDIINNVKNDISNRIDKKMVEYINRIINRYINENKRSEVKYLLKLGRYYNKELIDDNIYYYNYYLINRLINNINKENELYYIDIMNNIYGDKMNILYTTLEYSSLNDLINEDISKIKINIMNDKYKNMEYQNIVKYCVFEYESNNNKIDIGKIELYMDVFNKYYKLRFNKSIDYDYELSKVVVKINNRNVECNLWQYGILEMIENGCSYNDVNNMINDNNKHMLNELIDNKIVSIVDDKYIIEKID